MPYYPEYKPAETGEAEKQKKAAEKKRKLLLLSFAVVFCLLIGYGAVRLVLYQSELEASRETSRELQEIYRRPETEARLTAPEMTEIPQAVSTEIPAPEAPTVSPASDIQTDMLLPVQYPDNPELKISDRFRAMRKKSQYIVGWLSFDETDEAVVQKDNTFFLNHDATGRKNSNGAIFLDSEIRLTNRPYTLILYGHNMKSGNMFGKLKKFKESTYFFRHRIITFDSLYEEGQYAVFAVLEVDTVPGTWQWFDLWSLAADRIGEREKAIRTLEKRSAVSSSLDVRADDQILLLVTCLDGDTERLIVAARRLRDGETADNLTIRQTRP